MARGFFFIDADHGFVKPSCQLLGNLLVSILDYTYIAPLRPNLTRWRAITTADRGLSVLRMLQYEHLRTLPLSGQVLDMGGGQHAKYLHLLPADVTLASVNIDPAIAPTHLVQPGQPLPFADASFDAVICLNTLEHIYDCPAVLAELLRVVRPGGAVHVTVPFMFRIHGHPDDYLRATPSWWRETFCRAGFARLDLTPLVWGRRSTATVVPGLRGILVRSRLHLALLLDILIAAVKFSGPRMTGPRGDRICQTAPGWFMTGWKPVS